MDKFSKLVENRSKASFDEENVEKLAFYPQAYPPVFNTANPFPISLVLAYQQFPHPLLQLLLY
ncbi:MAG: hypothetical protein IKI64_01645 [Clostridia bacterium]|nr:hypothetical protein [Clostridia bacterium]